MGSAHSPESLRILCLGDSLTDGYTMSGVSFAPYSETLEKRLKESGRHVTVVTDGISGDLVTTGSFRRRMERRCKSFDMVIRAVLNTSFENLDLFFYFLSSFLHFFPLDRLWLFPAPEQPASRVHKY